MINNFVGKWHLKHLFINLGLKTTFKMYLDGQFDQKIMFSKKMLSRENAVL